MCARTHSKHLRVLQRIAMKCLEKFDVFDRLYQLHHGWAQRYVKDDYITMYPTATAGWLTIPRSVIGRQRMEVVPMRYELRGSAGQQTHKAAISWVWRHPAEGRAGSRQGGCWQKLPRVNLVGGQRSDEAHAEQIGHGLRCWWLRRATLDDALHACRGTPWCMGVTADGGLNCTFFSDIEGIGGRPASGAAHSNGGGGSATCGGHGSASLAANVARLPAATARRGGGGKGRGGGGRGLSMQTRTRDVASPRSAPTTALPRHRTRVP